MFNKGNDVDTNKQVPQSGKHGMLRAFALIVTVQVALVAVLQIAHVPLGTVLVLLILACIVALFGKQLTGPAEDVQIFSSPFEHRIQNRYRSESNQLSNLGFTHLFFYGEGFPLFRLLLIYPAFLFLMMVLNREVATVQDGSKIVFGFSIFLSSDGTTYAHPNQLGMKFHTLFQDGTILMTKSFRGHKKYGPTVVVHGMSNASTNDAWAEHQKQIQTLEATGKQIDRQINFEAFSKISREA